MRRALFLLSGLVLAGCSRQQPSAPPMAENIAVPVAAPVAVRPSEPPAAVTTTPDWVARVFDTSRLHQIVITVPSAHLTNFHLRNSERVRATISFDGTVLENIGLRQQGGNYVPYVDIAGKPSLSLKFNEFVKGQGLFGLHKLVLKHQKQDNSLVNEHMSYEVFRRAGVPAPLTAYAQVTINGADQGIYLLREPITKQFLARNYGKDMDEGNLYEITLGGDPVLSPERIELKDEVEDGRSRNDVRALAAAFRSSTGPSFTSDISEHLDLDRFITFFAAETAVSASDGYSHYVNNTYVYAHPGYGFVFIPHGGDLNFWSSIRKVNVPGQLVRGALATRVFGTPELKRQYEVELARIGSESVWNKPALLARMEEVSKVLATANPTPRAQADIAKFKSSRTMIETFIRGGGTTQGTAYMR